jgi:hypothetical protein
VCTRDADRDPDVMAATCRVTGRECKREVEAGVEFEARPRSETVVDEAVVRATTGTALGAGGGVATGIGAGMHWKWRRRGMACSDTCVQELCARVLSASGQTMHDASLKLVRSSAWYSSRWMSCVHQLLAIGPSTYALVT